MATFYPETYNPNANYYGTINSANMQPQPDLSSQIVQPQQTPVYPVASLNQQLDQASQLTQPELQANDLTTQLQQLNQQLVGQSDYRAQQEQQQNIAGLTQTQNDLSNRLTALKNEALAIPLQLQQQATGRGITAAGLQPLQTAALRNNAIQALSVNSLLEASRGNLATAQQLVDRAVAQKYDPLREEIAAKTANLDLILKSPAYTQAEKKRALQQQLLLQDRNRQLDAQQEYFKTAQAMAAAALKLNPNDPQAAFNAQQVMKLDPSDPQYLSKVFSLVGQYQDDPNAIKQALLDMQYKQEQVYNAQADRQLARDKFNLDKQLSQAQIDKIRADIAQQSPGASGQITSDAASVLENVNNILSSGAISKVTGFGAYNPFNSLPGSTAQDVNAKVSQLKSLLSLQNRSKLKGQGQISDFEGRLLQQAATQLNKNLSASAFEQELRRIRAVVNVMNGVPVTYTVTDPKTGQSQTVIGNEKQLQQADMDGMVITYQ